MIVGAAYFGGGFGIAYYVSDAGWKEATVSGVICAAVMALAYGTADPVDLALSLIVPGLSAFAGAWFGDRAGRRRQ